MVKKFKKKEKTQEILASELSDNKSFETKNWITDDDAAEYVKLENIKEGSVLQNIFYVEQMTTLLKG